MSSKLLLLAFLFMSGCGVKQYPLTEKDQAIDSYIGKYTKQTKTAVDVEKEEDQEQKKK